MANVNSYHGPVMSTATTMWWVARNTSGAVADTMCIYVKLPKRENLNEVYRLQLAAAYHDSGAAKTCQLSLFSADLTTVPGVTIDSASVASATATNFTIPDDFNIPQDFWVRMTCTPGAADKLVQLTMYAEIAER